MKNRLAEREPPPSPPREGLLFRRQEGPLLWWGVRLGAGALGDVRLCPDSMIISRWMGFMGKNKREVKKNLPGVGVEGDQQGREQQKCKRSFFPPPPGAARSSEVHEHIDVDVCAPGAAALT